MDAVVVVRDRVVGERDQPRAGDVAASDRNAILTGRSGSACTADVELIDADSVRGGNRHDGIEVHPDRLGQTGVQRIVDTERHHQQRVESGRRHDRPEDDVVQVDCDAIVFVPGHHRRSEDFHGGGRSGGRREIVHDVRQCDVDAVSTGVAADRFVARDADARLLGVRDADINAVSAVAVDRVGRPVARHVDDGRADIVDADVDAIPGQAVERAVQRDDRRAGVAVVDAVRPESVTRDGIGPLGNQKGIGSGVLSVKSDAVTVVASGGDRVETGRHKGPVVRLKVEAVAAMDRDTLVSQIVVGGRRVEQQQRLRSDPVGSHEDSIRQSGVCPVPVERSANGPEIQLSTQQHLSHESTQLVAIGRTVLHFDVRLSPNSRRGDPQTRSAVSIEVRVDQTGVESAAGIDQGIESIARIGPARVGEFEAGSAAGPDHGLDGVHAGIVEVGAGGRHIDVRPGTRRADGQPEGRRATRDRVVQHRRAAQRQIDRAAARARSPAQFDTAGTRRRSPAVLNVDVRQSEVGHRSVRGSQIDAVIRRSDDRTVLNRDVGQRSGSVHQAEDAASLPADSGRFQRQRLLTAVVQVDLIVQRDEGRAAEHLEAAVVQPAAREVGRIDEDFQVRPARDKLVDRDATVAGQRALVDVDAIKDQVGRVADLRTAQGADFQAVREVVTGGKGVGGEPSIEVE